LYQLFDEVFCDDRVWIVNALGGEVERNGDAGRYTSAFCRFEKFFAWVSG
jgi:hypothetical protein